MFFLGIISWNGVSCFNGGFAFQMGVFIFKCGEGGVVGRYGISFGVCVCVGGGFKKNRTMGVAPYAPAMGNPEKNHLTIKNNCSILKKQ